MLSLSQNAATWMNFLSNVAVVIGAVMALIGALGTFWSSSELNRYADARANNQELLTAQANETAARATEKAAELEKQAASIQLDANRARADAARLELQLQELQTMRTLSKEQVEKFSQALKAAGFEDAKPPIGVGAVGDAEAEMFALQLMGILKSSGANIYPTPGGILPRQIAQLTPSKYGVLICTSTKVGEPTTLFVRALAQALADAGHPPELMYDGDLEPGTSQLNVVRKPTVSAAKPAGSATRPSLSTSPY